MAMLKAKIQAELQQSGRNKQRHKLKLIRYKWRHSRPRFCARPSPAGTKLAKSSRGRPWGWAWKIMGRMTEEKRCLLPCYFVCVCCCVVLCYCFYSITDIYHLYLWSGRSRFVKQRDWCSRCIVIGRFVWGVIWPQVLESPFTFAFSNAK